MWSQVLSGASKGSQRRSTAYQVRRSVLAPKRNRDSGSGPVECKVNHQWIKEGRVTEKDCCPELRTAQVQGRQLCVIGASLEACSVCTEAWHSGFKPVLVLLTDKIDEQCTREVRSAAATLRWNCYKSGSLNCGFKVLITESRNVRVSLDRQGQPIEATVIETSSRLSLRVSRKSEKTFTRQSSFQNPVIVIGSVLSHDMVDDTHEHSLAKHMESVAETSAALPCPEFWEERYDPDCLPLATSTYGLVIPCFALGALQLLLLVVIFHFHEEPLFGLIRILVDSLAKLPCVYGCTICFGYMIGMRVPPWPTRYHICIAAASQVVASLTMLPKFGGHLVISDFASSMFLLSTLTSLIAVYAKFVAKVSLNRWSLVWYVMALQGTCGSYMSSIPILLVYQFLLRTNGTAASLFLSFAFSASETCVVKMASLSYDKIILGKRKEGIPCVVGDQKRSLSLVFTAIHMFTETARLSALICGAIGAEDGNFLVDATTSLATAVTLNTLGRTGLLATILVHIPVVGRKVCPTTHWGMHNNAKFTMGWGRFIIVLGLMLGRGILHWKWDFPWNVGDVSQDGSHGSWCWSGVVLLTVLMAFGAEMLEDTLVYAISSQGIPKPRSKIYIDVMRSRMQNPKTSKPYHTCHYTIPRKLHDAVTEYEGLQAEDWCDCIHAPNLTNVRVYDTNEIWTYVGASLMIVLTNLSIGVGSANMFGFCPPTQDFSQVLSNVVLYNMKCES